MATTASPPSSPSGQDDSGTRLFTDARKRLLSQWLSEKTGRRPEVLQKWVDGFAAAVYDRELVVVLLRENVTTTFSQRLLPRLLEGVQVVGEQGEVARQELVSAGALRLVGLTLQKKREEEDAAVAVEKAFAALWSLSLSEAVRSALAPSTGPLLATSTMQEWIDRPATVYQALGALRTLGTQAGIRERLREGGCWGAAMQALYLHATDAGIQYLGLACLWTLALDRPATLAGLEEERGRRTAAILLRSLTQHPDDADVQHQGWGLIATLCFASIGNRQALLHAGVVAPLARALRRHYRRPEVVKQACGSCWLLAQGDGRTKAQLGEAGAVEALVRAMGHHNLHHHHHRPADPAAAAAGEVTYHAAGALLTLLRGSPSNAERAGRAGAWQLLFRLLARVQQEGGGGGNKGVETLSLVVGAIQLCGAGMGLGEAEAEEACLAVISALHSAVDAGGGGSGGPQVRELVNVVRLSASRDVQLGSALAHNGAIVLLARILERHTADAATVLAAAAALSSLAARAAPSTTAADGPDPSRMLLAAAAAHPTNRAVQAQALAAGKALAKVAGLRARLLDRSGGGGPVVVTQLVALAESSLQEAEDGGSGRGAEACRLSLSWMRTLSDGRSSGDERLRDMLHDAGVARLLARALRATAASSSSMPGVLAECLGLVDALCSGGGRRRLLAEQADVIGLLAAAVQQHACTDRELVTRASAVVTELLPQCHASSSSASHLLSLEPWLRLAASQPFAHEPAVAEQLGPALAAIEHHTTTPRRPHSPLPPHRPIASPTPAFDLLADSPPPTPLMVLQPSADLARPAQARWPAPPPATSSPPTPSSVDVWSPVLSPSSVASPVSTRREWKEEEEEEESKLCVVCWEVAATHAMVPCGHRCVCEDHAALIMKGAGECPMCRGAVQTAVRIYL